MEQLITLELIEFLSRLATRTGKSDEARDVCNRITHKLAAKTARKSENVCDASESTHRVVRHGDIVRFTLQRN